MRKEGYYVIQVKGNTETWYFGFWIKHDDPAYIQMFYEDGLKVTEAYGIIPRKVAEKSPIVTFAWCWLQMHNFIPLDLYANNNTDKKLVVNKKYYSLNVRGKEHEWSFSMWLDPKLVEEATADGIKLERCAGDIPAFVADLGRPAIDIWTFLQKIYIVPLDWS